MPPIQSSKAKMLVLHGSRQTGQLLLTRLAKLEKKLASIDVALVAPDGPFMHADDKQMRQWWQRSDNSYEGLEESIQVLQSFWLTGSFVGMLGFSMGARLVHLLMMLHTAQPEVYFPGVQCCILVAGYDAPVPPQVMALLSGMTSPLSRLLSIPSLHVWGLADQLVTPDQSQALTQHYENAQILHHDGGHHVPLQAARVQTYVNFVQQAMQSLSPPRPTGSSISTKGAVPDDEHCEMQVDEVQAISVIFPDEFSMLSARHQRGEDAWLYEHPIRYQVVLSPSDQGVWPPLPISVRIKYPPNYPTEAGPILDLKHDNNIFQFSSRAVQACQQAMKEAAAAEQGMPCVLSCVYAVRDILESRVSADKDHVDDAVQPADDAVDDDAAPASKHYIKPVTPERIRHCELEGLAIADRVLATLITQRRQPVATGQGGAWNFVVGVVGKPSSGKSTFFNAATAFARQRKDTETALGGATMAPHPFTTIDPNIGFCLVPAPPGSCPEDGLLDAADLNLGCTHGRDHLGRRLLPVLLKDVAGLVPGAYQGRGRGNMFLNDLVDADALIHVVDASGSADAEGNMLGLDAAEIGTNPLVDLAWVHAELIEWVHSNLLAKWYNIRRKGRSKLTDMFSGYGQPQSLLCTILDAVEEHMMHAPIQIERPLEQLQEWDEGDVRRLVSVFLGVRFPMALALNKVDLPRSKSNVHDILQALPTNGARVGTPLSAKREMEFVKTHVLQNVSVAQSNGTRDIERTDLIPPRNVWQCLHSAIELRSPMLVFPVSDFEKYAPLPGLTEHFITDPSLPSPAMLGCIEAAGGQLPTLWQKDRQIYAAGSSRTSRNTVALRDAIMMKPGSSVEDAFLVLKRRGALGGEFVRAEAAADVGAPSKPVPKGQLLSLDCRILKIMTSKRTQWQK